jgi:Spy/CpxP family protein refolding chaperone
MSPFAIAFTAFLGTLAAVALLGGLAALRMRRWRRWRARMGSGALPTRFMMRGLFQRLGTRPEQEAAILADADALASELRALRDDGRALREELSALLEAPSLDRARLDETLSSRVARLDALRTHAAEALARLHGQLDEAQRRTLSALLRQGAPAWAHARRGRGC